MLYGNRFRLLGIGLLCFSMQGCFRATEIEHSDAFETSELDSCLTIIVDTSSSFQSLWDEKAYDLFVEISDRFFAESTGSESRLILAQLSASDDVVLFEGRPSDLTQRFAGPDELMAYLTAKSDSSGSNVFDATRRTIDYANSIEGVTENTRLLTIILSDMLESERDRATRISMGAQMLESLKQYKNLGGGLGLYFVATTETPRWRRILNEAGFQPGQYVIENVLTESPRLPTFH